MTSRKKVGIFKQFIVFGLSILLIIPTFITNVLAESEETDTKNQEATEVKGIPGEVELDDDPNIAEWQKLQYGMFIHWGLYSELGGEWDGEPVTDGYSEQIKMWADIPDEDYLDIANNFSADSFDADEVCSLAKDAGMEYVVMTSKHHDGFAMFDTDTTDYNIVDSTPYKEDPMKELSDACRAEGLGFGVYFSLVDWNEGHDYDYNNVNPIPESMEPMIENQLKELMTNYGTIDEVWFDMSSPTSEQSKKFKDIVHEYQPEAAVNSRIWNNEGDFRTLGDNEVPDVSLDGAWQTPASIYHETWGYRKWQEREDKSEKVDELVESLVSVQARGGNYLLNIGPRGDGSIVGFEADVLSSIGDWLDQHPDAVLGASATEFNEQPWGEVTVNDNNLYLHVMDWPEDGEITLPGLVNEVTNVSEDETSNNLDWNHDGDELVVQLPDEPKDGILPVMKAEFEGELSIIPEETVSPDSNNSWIIEAEDIDSGYNYADEGNYSNTERTNVRQTMYIETEKEKSVFLDLNAEANEDKRYKVEIGDYSEEFTGKELNDASVGPINLPGEEVVPLTITLADPSHKNEDMDLEVHAAYLGSFSSASDMKEIINHYEGESIDADVAHALKMHLNAVEQYESTEADDKVVKHLKGFIELLDHYEKDDEISMKSHNALKMGTDSLIKKWK